MEDLKFRVEHVEFKGKKYLAFAFDGDFGPVHFISMKNLFTKKRYWWCVEDKKKVPKELSSILDGAMSTIAKDAICL